MNPRGDSQQAPATGSDGHDCPPGLYQALVAAVGKSHVSVDMHDLNEMAGDATLYWRRDAAPSALPWAVVRPASTQEAAAVVAAADGQQAPIVPYGGGSGLMGGAVTVKPGIVLDLRRMNRVLGVSPADRSVHVQAGAVLKDLNAALEAQRFILGHDPWSLPVATVGGAISTNGLGYLAGRYGSMGDQVLGLTVVLASGDILKTRPLPTQSVGINLNHLFIGAEGTMGVITEAVLRIFPQPESRKLYAIAFPDFEAGFTATQDMLALGMRPAIADYGDSYDLPGGAGAGRLAASQQPVLYLALDGFREEVDAQEQRVLEICERLQGQRLPAEAAEGYWAHRHDSGERFRADRLAGTRPNLGQPNTSYEYLNVVAPASRVLEYRRRALALLAENGVTLLESGFWGLPELFAIFIAKEGRDEDEAAEIISQVANQLMTLAQDMGGAMEQCHGVGLRRAHLMARQHGLGLAVMRELKRALDPRGIMNPGKLALD